MLRVEKIDGYASADVPTRVAFDDLTPLYPDERLLMVFPEGSRGTAKLYGDRNSLVGFGTGFLRLALASGG